MKSLRLMMKHNLGINTRKFQLQPASLLSISDPASIHSLIGFSSINYLFHASVSSFRSFNPMEAAFLETTDETLSMNTSIPNENPILNSSSTSNSIPLDDLVVGVRNMGSNLNSFDNYLTELYGVLESDEKTMKNLDINPERKRRTHSSNDFNLHCHNWSMGSPGMRSL